MSRAPIHSLALKVAAPCNINCGYCYEYNRGDHSWRKLPKLIEIGTAERLGQRIHEYCAEAGLNAFNVNLHGGEPTLLGAKGIAEVILTMRRAAAGIRINFGMQTNATLISSSILAVLTEFNVRVGTSLDGSAHANRHRVDHQGQPTWSRTADGIRRLEEAGLLAGIQAVIDLDSSPEEVLFPLVDFGARLIELGQPIATHDNPPPTSSRYSLGAWLCEAFDLWTSDSRLAGVKVQVFHDAIRAVLTDRPDSEWFPGLPPGYLIVATNGAYEGLDTLKVVGDIGRVLGYNVFSATISQALSHEYIMARSDVSRLCATCTACSLVKWCAGGYYPTRFGRGNGFLNPSYYCADLRFFFIHVASWLLDQHGVDVAIKSRIRDRMRALAGTVEESTEPIIVARPERRLALTIRGESLDTPSGVRDVHE